jgi:hypothetical protein
MGNATANRAITTEISGGFPISDFAQLPLTSGFDDFQKASSSML